MGKGWGCLEDDGSLCRRPGIHFGAREITFSVPSRSHRAMTITVRGHVQLEH